jgi:8-oxo-dGTP pyrophosphatase MutT (NUDIX family)
MIHTELVAIVHEALQRELPGHRAQVLMAPRPRGTWPPGEPMAPRDAAGLLLLFPVANRSHVVLTVRSAHVRHGGQVSMPGGVVEEGESFADAALREAREEVSFAAHDLRVLGALTAIDIPVSGFRLHPIVAALDRPPDLEPSDHEVARIIDVPIATLLEPTTVVWRSMRRGAVEVDAPGFAVENTLIWGATAMVLAELLWLIGWNGPPSDRS